MVSKIGEVFFSTDKVTIHKNSQTRFQPQVGRDGLGADLSPSPSPMRAAV